ncbi:hypothetical protein [Hyphomicrobium sp. CS1BSMeth3]|uniref:hypothetical protein n=1 Tax=Hyphomicrobium sp. CS1BSMeth3 TaxID=1892844 RepID=UPI001160DB57|nr:hypothetical protein [Hyphomicrobium sp. CS1BSMeth3]
MKRTLLAAVLGGLITLVGGAVTAQAAPITVPKSTEAETSLVQTTGYGYHHRRYVHRNHWRHRPVVRWHYYTAPRRYVRPHYQHRHWTHRYNRRHYH